MITTSFFELFKIGPGPSSSHTVGPMRAANKFRKTVLSYLATHYKKENNYQIKVELYGALAATGHGHGTHRAIYVGLCGQQPETVNINQLNNAYIPKGIAYKIDYPPASISFTEDDIFFNYKNNPYWHPNSMKLIFCVNQQMEFEEVYFSIGGGFIEREGNKEEKQIDNIATRIPFSYSNMAELVKLIKVNQKRVDYLLLENEMAIHQQPLSQILANIDKIMEVMHQSVVNGLEKEGELPGGLGVFRRAKCMYQKAIKLEKQKRYADALFCKLNAYALATSEENADGQIVVTAPTNGAAGIIPACLEYLRNDCHIPQYLLQRGLLVAGMIGFIIKENASISGAALGCMAEVGSASSMAAALFSYCNGGNIHQICTAAEIALEHHLGMTCDPIKGLVQVPCIERNANGAVKAYNAYLLAAARTENTGQPIITFDQVVEVMRQTGEDLSNKYKETAMGGLATTFGWGNMPGS